MASRIATKSCLLGRPAAPPGRPPPPRAWSARIMRRTIGQPVLGQEHVLGPAQPDPLGPEAAGVGRVGTVVGVGPHGQRALADLVGPAEDDVELRRAARPRSSSASPSTTRPVLPSMRDHVAFVDGHAAGGEAGRPRSGPPRRRPRPACPSPGPPRRRGSPGRPGR